MTEATAVAELGEHGREVAPPENEDGDITSLVRYALEKEVPVEVLERLVALQERVSDRNARMAFVRAMSAFQSEVGPIFKTGVIPDNHGNERSRFAPLPVIAETIRDPLAKHGLSYSWDSTDDGEFTEVRCTVRHIDGHSETASFKCRTKDAAAPKMSGVQISGSARTYGMRYSLKQALGLTEKGEDNDGNVPRTYETISDKQEADLQALIEEVGADKAKFLEWMGVESLSDIPAAHLETAVRSLEKKRKKAKEAS